MIRKHSIAIFNTNLNIGGITSSLLNILKSEIFSEYRIDLYLFDKGGIDFEKDFTSNINIIWLRKFPAFCKILPFRLVRNFCQLIGVGKRIENEYDYVIDFNGYSTECAVYVTLIKKGNRIIWIHNDFEKRLQYNHKFRLLWYAMKKKMFYYDKIVCVSKGVAKALIKVVDIQENNIRIIPNIIDSKAIIEKSLEPAPIVVDENVYNLVYLGKLVPAKAVDKTIYIFSEVLKRRDDIRLFLIGDGESEKRLKEMVSRLGMQDKVYFLGEQGNPFPYLRQMDGLILNSNYEGQGMVVREAQVLGLDIFISDNLRKYNEGIIAYNDLRQPLVEAKRHKQEIDYLEDYNQEVKRKLVELITERSNR